MLAEELSNNNIASLRYDKRGIGESVITNFDESKLRFEDYIEDAEAWIDYLRQDSNFSKIVVIGHSEGSLIGMIASKQSDADIFVSIAGAGRPIGSIIKEPIKFTTATSH